LIPVINRLQDVFNSLGTDPIDLPQIVVVGSQSSGKSSVLEHIVGKDFLPRGSGIVTRRPLVLQLNHLPPEVNKVNGPESEVEWGEFLHKPNEMFYDFQKIREEIERETERLTGKNKALSPLPINLKIYSPFVLNLTLVDLPGMTKVPVGDQPQDIEIQIKKMIMTFIQKPNSIILAITAANSDLSNSDALQLSKEVDPEGNRTIGVLTKLDIMDKGTDALEMLMGKVIPLKLGFIGVVNRSQQDIITKKSIRDALKSEDDFFSNHPTYKNLSSRCGTALLTKTLNKILIQHIRDCLPELKVKVNKMMSDVNQELATYGDPLYDTKGGRGALLLQVITRFSSSYRDAIDGKLSELSISELYGGARVNFIFNEIFSKYLDDINPTEGLTGNDIRTAIRNATGPKASLFVPEVSFELLVKGQISRLEDPGLQCVELVHDELQRIVSTLESKVGELIRFAKLRDAVVETVNNLLFKYKQPTKEMITNLVNIELSFINTNHPDFVGGDGAISAILEKMQKSQQAEKDSKNLQNQTNKVAPALPSKQQTSSSPPVNSTQNGTYPETQQTGFLSMFFGNSSISNNNKSLSNGQKEINPTKQETQINSQKSQHLSVHDPTWEKLDQVPITLKPISTPSDKEVFETELIKYLLVSYFNIVRKNIKDYVPKTIMHFLVNHSKESIQNELVAALYKEELFDELLEESSIAAQRREECKNLAIVLKKAHDILNEVRDYQIN